MMEKLARIIGDILANKGAEAYGRLSPSTDLRVDLGFDSFDMAELTVHVEDAFGVDIFEDGIVRTVGEICGKIEKK